jgi:hypothetical protein
MKIGTKSLLFGAHQFIIHPITVLLAAIKMRGKFPNWKECICIFVHDWGYWGCENMEGEEGLVHPEYGALIVNKLLDHNFHMGSGHVSGDDKWDTLAKKTEWKYYYFCRYHSRSYASKFHQSPSELCWWDKLCVLYDPWWLYLPRVYLSGEIHEYRAEATKAGLITESMTDREWYEWARERMVRKAYAQDARPPYTEGS